MIRTGNARVLNVQQPQQNFKVIASFGIAAITVFVLGAFGTIVPFFGGNEIATEPTTISPQDIQGAISLGLNNAYYTNGERISLEPGTYNFQCQVINTNPGSDIQFDNGALNGIQNSASTVQNGDNFIHTVFTMVRFDDDVNISPVLTCRSGANSISIFVDIEVETSISAIQSLDLIIDDTPVPNGSRLQLEQGQHNLKCVAISSDPDVDISWDLFGVKVSQPIGDMRSTVNGDGTYRYESEYSGIITRLANGLSSIGCTALATGANTVTTMILIDFRDVELGLEIDSISYSNGQQVILEDGDHTLTCAPLLASSSSIEVVWKLNNGFFSQRHSFTGSFSAGDCGKELRCEVRDDDTSPVIQVTILVKTQPSSVVITPAQGEDDSATPVIIDGREIQVVNGSRITLQCTANGGDGEPTVSWELHRSNAHSVKQVHVGMENSVDCIAQPVTHDFTFVPIFDEHQSNTLQCSAAEDLVETQFLVNVMVPPKSAFLTLKVDGTSYKSDKVLYVTGPLHEFQCTASNSKPSPAISWTFGTQQVRENTGFSTTNNQGLASYTSTIYSQYVTGTTRVSCTADNGIPSAAPASISIDIVVVCGDISAPTNGDVSSSNSDYFTEGATLTFSCNDGFMLSGSTTITCRSDGSWNDVAPTCSQVVCPSVFAITGDFGFAVSPSDSDFSVDTTLTFACNDGNGELLIGLFEIIDYSSITCQSNGEWNMNPPTGCSIP